MILCILSVPFFVDHCRFYGEELNTLSLSVNESRYFDHQIRSLVTIFTELYLPFWEKCPVVKRFNQGQAKNSYRVRSWYSKLSNKIPYMDTPEHELIC